MGIKSFSDNSFFRNDNVELMRTPIEVKQKLFKVDTEVLKNWEKFVAEHKQYKVQNLISMALGEFIDKYK